MPRAKRGNKRTERRKKILDLAKGYRGTKSKLYRSAKESVERGLKFAYTGRKLKKRISDPELLPTYTACGPSIPTFPIASATR